MNISHQAYTLFCCLFFISIFGYTPAAKAQIKIMSYNIRYDNPDDAPNTWNNRKEDLAALIRFHRPIFLGTQEVLHNQLQDLNNLLEGYHSIGVGRKDGNTKGEYSAIFYDTTKAKLIAHTDSTIWLSKTPQKPSKSWDAALPRILTWGKFRLTGSGKHIYVFNTHFDHIGKKARAQSAQLILDTISNIAGDSPVVLTGDFNIPDDSEPYQIINDSFLTDSQVETKLPPVGPAFTFNGFNINKKSHRDRIDYIFTNGKVDVKKYAVISSFKNDYYLSDHLPVISVIELIN